jgi:hypothetical protein
MFLNSPKVLIKIRNLAQSEANQNLNLSTIKKDYLSLCVSKKLMIGEAAQLQSHYVCNVV